MVKVTRIDRLEIKWPSGSAQQVTVPRNRASYVEEGKGVITK